MVAAQVLRADTIPENVVPVPVFPPVFPLGFPLGASPGSCSLQTIATQECFEVPRGVHDPKNFDSVRARAVQYEQFLEARYSKHSQRRKSRVLEAGTPSHVGLGSEERKGFVGSEKKVVTNSGVRLRGKIISLVDKVLIGLRANNVASRHRAPVLFRRSSNRRCWFSQ